jgi:hypothetical protein
LNGGQVTAFGLGEETLNRDGQLVRAGSVEQFVAKRG